MVAWKTAFGFGPRKLSGLRYKRAAEGWHREQIAVIMCKVLPGWAASNRGTRTGCLARIVSNAGQTETVKEP